MQTQHVGARRRKIASPDRSGERLHDRSPELAPPLAAAPIGPAWVKAVSLKAVSLKAIPRKAVPRKAVVLRAVLATVTLLIAGCSSTSVTTSTEDFYVPDSTQPPDVSDAESAGRGESPKPTETLGEAGDADADPTQLTTQPTTGSLESEPVKTGAERLVESDFEAFSGMAVGLIVNQTSVVHRTHLIDLVNNSGNVTLGAIFAPEHGVRGTADAGELVNDDIDATTGVTIFSLYGSTRQPSLDMLAGIDVLFYDLQDVGTRHYTYISTMGLAMQTAAEAGIPFVVLDRPNPLGGINLFGPVLEDALISFIGQYPIPSGYGLTAGELALAIKGERWLEGLEQLDLQIAEMRGWSRSMVWPDTGLDWIAPSPGLPTFDAALLYPGTVLIESTALSYGAGTSTPFETVGASWIDADGLVSDLQQRGLAGVEFEPVDFVPSIIVNVAPNPRLEGQQLQGVHLVSVDDSQVDPFRIGLELLDALEQQAAAAGLPSIVERGQIFDLLTGSTTLRQDLLAGVAVQEILDGLRADLTGFDQLRQPYLLY